MRISQGRYRETVLSRARDVVWKALALDLQYTAETSWTLLGRKPILRLGGAVVLGLCSLIERLGHGD